MTSCPASLISVANDWYESKVIERMSYERLTSAIEQAERMGVPEVEIIRGSGLSRMTVRKYRRRAVPRS